MELIELRKKVIAAIEHIEKPDILEEVLFLLDKNNRGEYIDILKWKQKIFYENDNLLKRLN